MSYRFIASAMYVVLALHFGSGPALAAAVNCDIGETIGAAIGSGETIINVSGTCGEDVIIVADNTQLIGNETATINGILIIHGAERVLVSSIAVTGSDDDGILLWRGGSAEFQTVDVFENESCGLDVREGAHAMVSNSQFHDNAESGICVGIGGVVTGFNNILSGNGITDLDVFQHGVYRGQGDSIGGSPGNAVTVSRNSFADFRPVSVLGRTEITDQSHLLIRRTSTIAGSIHVDNLSELDLSQTTSVDGSIQARNLSIVKRAPTVTVTGNVVCQSGSRCIQ